jgi:hypothetical protein
MMRFSAVAAGCAASVLLGSAAPSLAFDHGCGGQAVECYEKVRLPDVYATRARQVVVRPGYSQVVTTPPVVVDRPERVVVSPGHWQAVATPAVTGTRAERVLVAPASRSYSDVPAVTRTVHETVVVHPGGVQWQHKRGWFGREKLCKVQTAPVTRTVAHNVVVAPARRVAHVTPAVYETVERSVVVRPASVQHVYQPPVHGYVNRQVVVQPATQRVISHPPVVAVAHERVLVRQGGYGWTRSGYRRGSHGLFDHH